MSSEGNRVKLLLIAVMVLYGVLQMTFGTRRNSRETTSPSNETDAAAAFDLQKWADIDWVYESSSNGIITWSKSVPNSKLLAFKGAVEIPFSIARATGPFIDLSLAHLWIEYMKSIKRLESDNSNETKKEERELESFCRLMERSTSATEGSASNNNGSGPVLRVLRAARRGISRLGQWLRRDEQGSGAEPTQGCKSSGKGVQTQSNQGEGSSKSKSKSSFFGDIDSIYQTFDLPWPIQDREILLKRKFCYSKEDKKVTVYYRSTVDERAPIDEAKYIRSYSPHTVWQFQSSSHIAEATRLALAAAQAKASPSTRHCSYHNRRSGDECTVLTIEAVVDSRGTIPVAFTNYIQKSFPAKSLGEYVRLVRRELAEDHKTVKSWSE